MDNNNIKYIHGDILTDNTEDKAVFICHQVNCKGVMGAGLAKQIRNKHPEVYNSYIARCNQYKGDSKGLLGSIQLISFLGVNGYGIINIFGQDDFGRDPSRVYTNYNALRDAFNNIASSLGYATIRIPYKMGCGLGNGDWETVLSLIQECIADKKVNVEIWEKV